MFLTHLSRMNIPISVNRTSLFQTLGVLGGVSHFYSKSIMSVISGDPDQTPCSAAADLGLHCLRMSHKTDARLNGLICEHVSVSK